MNRYNVESADRYDMEPAPDGMWVMHDDAQAAIAAAVAAEREARQEAQRRLEALQERINHADKEKAQAVAAERERCAKLCESARFTGNTFPRTQMEQLRMDIAAAIRGN
ncbi:MAG TPA: hypothetical protein PLE35_12620 [Lentisphaeria bacterium]|nr:hypothetical protein [Lentisphaeria bacterium]